LEEENPLEFTMEEASSILRSYSSSKNFVNSAFASSFEMDPFLLAASYLQAFLPGACLLPSSI